MMLLAAAFVLLTASQTVRLSLTADRTTIREGEDPGFHARLVNDSDRPIRLVAIQDGSPVHWRNPHVGWAITGDNRSPMPTETPVSKIGRCGNVNPIEPSHFMTLAPHSATELSLGWCPLNLFGNAPVGRSRVAFYYEVVSGGREPSAGANVQEQYRNLTPLKLRSNSVRLIVTPR